MLVFFDIKIVDKTKNARNKIINIEKIKALLKRVKVDYANENSIFVQFKKCFFENATEISQKTIEK